MKYFLPSFLLAYSSVCAASDKDNSSDIEEVFVTATLNEQPLKEVLGATSVIHKDYILSTQPVSLPDLLEPVSLACSLLILSKLKG